ncbi:MAG: HU family DNA-binding protein [Anaerolineae bacterium]
MSLNKNKMVREIGRRTRLKNRDVQMMLETLIDVWSEELVAGGHIELADNLTLLFKIPKRLSKKPIR